MKLKQAIAILTMLPAMALAQSQKTETFDHDPGWDGHNNRIAREKPPVLVRQDFGYAAAKIGGTITIAGEPAYYAKKIEPRTLNDRLTASGTLVCKKGSG